MFVLLLVKGKIRVELENEIAKGIKRKSNGMLQREKRTLRFKFEESKSWRMNGEQISTEALHIPKIQFSRVQELIMASD